jgi:hypothetical protein
MIAQRLEAPARMKSQFADPSPLIAIIHIEDIHAASIPTSAMYLAPATPADPTTWTLTIEQYCAIPTIDQPFVIPFADRCQFVIPSADHYQYATLFTGPSASLALQF